MNLKKKKKFDCNQNWILYFLSNFFFCNFSHFHNFPVGVLPRFRFLCWDCLDSFDGQWSNKDALQDLYSTYVRNLLTCLRFKFTIQIALHENGRGRNGKKHFLPRIHCSHLLIKERLFFPERKSLGTFTGMCLFNSLKMVPA